MEALTSIHLPPLVSRTKPIDPKPDAGQEEAKSEPAAVEAEPAGDDDTGSETAPFERVEELLNSALGSRTPANSRLQISVHDDTGMFIYRAIHKDTGEVLHQYPAEEVLRELAYYRNLEGIAVDETA